MHGVLVVDKPAGMTSAAVVAQVKRALGARRVGHAGTLDPMATGVLVVCVGEGTKIAGYLLADDKHYEAELVLGVETDTLDADGEVTRRAPVEVTPEQLAAALAALRGDGEQVPPMHSALKRDGKRLYQLARAGVEVDRPPRPITVHDLELLDCALPRARFRVSCSKGTYVRALVRDVGSRLGCGAHLSALRRTRSGGLSLATAIRLDELQRDATRAVERLVDPAAALPHLRGYPVPEHLLGAVRDGQRLPWSEIAPRSGAAPEQFKLVTPSGQLAALASVDAGRVRYLRVFTYGLTSPPDSSKLSHH